MLMNSGTFTKLCPKTPALLKHSAMIPTPDLSHLTKEDYDHIYEPAEDTFLLLDALEEDMEGLKSSKPSICLEVGSGSGCVTSFLAKILGTSVLYLCTDINPHACKCTYLTGKQNKVTIDVINGSLDTPIVQRLSGRVDVAIFNPPYVPTSEEEALEAQKHGNIGGAWAGGSDGMQVTNIFLARVERLLSPGGRFYLVALKENNIPKMCKDMNDKYGLQSEVVIQRRAGREHLFILRFTRTVQGMAQILL